MNPAPQSFHESLLVLAAATLIVWVLIHVAMWLMSATRRKWLLAPISLLAAWAFWSSALSVIDSQFETAGTWPRSVLALIAAVTCEAVLILYVDHRGSKRGVVHWIPIGLRLLLVLILAFILLEPIVSHQKEESSQRHVAVLMDASASMDLSDFSLRWPTRAARRRNRREASRQLLLEKRSGNQSLLDQLQVDYNVRLYDFAATPRELKVADWRDERVAGDHRSNLPDSSFSARMIGRIPPTRRRRSVEWMTNCRLDELSGLIVLTDGCDHSRADLKESVRNLVHRRIPVHTVVVGDQMPICDAEVTMVQAPQHVFHGDSVAIRASIKVDRLQGQEPQGQAAKDDGND